MAIFVEAAPAKVNLTLEILGKRPDGYHELRSLVAFAKTGDVVTLDTAKPVAVTVSGPFAGGIAGQNLLEVALIRLQSAEPRLTLGAVHLEKRLPTAAGIGGGSADAAALLRAVRCANPNLAAAVDWQRIGLSLGADVPVCLVSRAAWMTGTGELVVALDDFPKLNAVICNPLVPMPEDKTARVFRALGAPPFSGHQEAAAPQETLTLAVAMDAIAFCARRGNHLETPALTVAPVIADVKTALQSAPGCLYAALSGAGPTCFGLFATQDARHAARQIQTQHPTWWVQDTELS